MRALHEHRLRIPQDVSLVGFDDMPAMDNMLAAVDHRCRPISSSWAWPR